MRRPSPPCPNCGSPLDDAARYCPMCGEATGAVVFDEPGAGDHADGPADVSLAASRRRWLVAVAAVVIAALVVLVTVFNGGHRPPRAALTTAPPPSPVTTVVPSSTTPTIVAPAVTVAVAQQVAPHREAAGVVVYLATSQGDVVRLDLGTGAVDRRTEFKGADQHTGPWLVMARQGGYVLSSPYDPGGVILGVSDAPASTPVVLQGPFDDNSVGSTQLAPATEPDEVWLWNQTEDLSTTTVRRVRIDGVVTAGPVTLPQFATVLGADGPGALALSGPGGMYRATVTGTDVRVAPLWPRLPIAYNDRALLDLSCSGSLDCRLEVVDRASQQRRLIGQKPGDVASPLFESLLSPDGAWLAHVDGRSPPTLTVYDLRGDGTPISHEILASASFGPLGQPASFAFSADGRWLVFLGPSDTVELWPVGTPQPPVTVTVPGLEGLTGLSVAPA